MNLGQTALHVLKTVAPELALAIGGPFGPIAAAALHVALGTTDDKSAEQALTNATPEQLLAMKKANDDFLVQMQTLGIQREKLNFDDTSNARLREMTVKDWTPRILGYSVVILTVLMEAAIMIWGQPKVDGVVLGRVLGTWDSATMLVLSYYFGSSAGSSAKTDMLNSIATGTGAKDRRPLDQVAGK